MESRSASRMPATLRLFLALGLPIIGAVTVVGIFLNKEVIVAAVWAAMCAVGFVFVRPVAGVVLLTAGLLMAAYPSILALGELTIGNLFGVCLLILLVFHVLGTRDLSFFKVPQIQLLFAIGLFLIAVSFYADTLFPMLQYSRGKGKILDKTGFMMNNFFTRLGLLVFISAFVRTTRDVKALFLTFMLVLFAAIPSALLNWLRGDLASGFRAMADFTAGDNANRLAMICLIQIACWWFWMRARPTFRRRAMAIGSIIASVMILFATGSRSGLLGFGVLLILLQTGPAHARLHIGHVGTLVIGAALTVATLTPSAAWERMLRFTTVDTHAPGAQSQLKRESTVNVGLDMFYDHPFTGVGLGNYQEVSRQIYRNRFFRPPHNSYVWAAAEGGIFVFLGYLAVFAVTWSQLRTIMRNAHRDWEIAHMAAAVRVTFLLCCFFSIFADLWLNPITYVVIGLVTSMHWIVVHGPAVEHVPAAATPRVAFAMGR